MTINQAKAILEAESVLQGVGCGGPDCSVGCPWFDFVRQATELLYADGSSLKRFYYLHLVQDVMELNNWV